MGWFQGEAMQISDNSMAPTCYDAQLSGAERSRPSSYPGIAINATVKDFDEQACPITLVYGFAACIEFVVWCSSQDANGNYKCRPKLPHHPYVIDLCSGPCVCSCIQHALLRLDSAQ